MRVCLCERVFGQIIKMACTIVRYDPVKAMYMYLDFK